MILLDTEAAICFLAEPERLSRPARLAIEAELRAHRKPAISVAGLFETAQLLRQGRMHSAEPAERVLEAMREVFAPLVIDAEIAERAALLPEPFPAAPSSRYAAATAMVRNCPLVTGDPAIRSARVCRVIW